MNTPTKLGGFALGLAAVFGGAYAAGHLTGPLGGTADANPTHASNARTTEFTAVTATAAARTRQERR